MPLFQNTVWFKGKVNCHITSNRQRIHLHHMVQARSIGEGGMGGLPPPFLSQQRFFELSRSCPPTSLRPSEKLKSTNKKKNNEIEVIGVLPPD